MQIIKTIIFSFICTVLIAGCAYADEHDEGYSVLINFFTENGSYIEYPQIGGLKDKEKQRSINALLKEQVYTGAKNYLNELFVDFSDPKDVYEFRTGAGFTNHDIASFWYAFDAYYKVDRNIQHNYRFYCVTIDMQTGKKIELPEFMVVDERLINRTDGSGLDTDYNSVARTPYRTFKDLYEVYTTEAEKDNLHNHTPQEAIDQLLNLKGETEWYIDEYKNIVFHHLGNSMDIPYDRLAELIYPQYLESLRKEQPKVTHE